MNSRCQKIVVKPFTVESLNEQLRLDVGGREIVPTILQEGMKEKARFWEQLAREEEFLGFMAYREDVPLGFINLLRASLVPYLFPEFRRNDALHVENKCLYVPPSYVEQHPRDSKEIYDALLSATVKYTKERGFIGISGIAWQDGVYRPDKSTYERHRFKVVHEFPQFKIYAVASYPVRQLVIKPLKVREDKAQVVTFGIPSCPFSLAAKDVAERACHELPQVEYEYVDVWKKPERALDLGFPGTGPLTTIDGKFLYWAANATPETLRQRINQHLRERGLLRARHSSFRENRTVEK